MSSSSPLLFLAAAVPLAAQAPDTTARDTVVLPTVTVTAARHRQDLFAVPLAVTQVRPRDLFGTRGYGLDEALTLVPGVLAQSRYGSSDVRLVIRGFGARGAGDRRGGQFYFTAASARRSGVELGLTLEGAGAISLQTALAYQRHRYGRYVVDSVHYNNPNPGRFADYSGNRVVGVPEFTYGASLGPAPRALQPLRLRLGLQGTSSYFADDANQVRVAAYRTASITVGVDEPVLLGGGLGIRGFATVNNLLDADYIASAFLNPDVVGGVPVAFEPGLPRNLVVGVTLARWSRAVP